MNAASPGWKFSARPCAMISARTATWICSARSRRKKTSTVVCWNGWTCSSSWRKFLAARWIWSAVGPLNAAAIPIAATPFFRPRGRFMSKDNAYLADILDSARIIQQHLSGMTREQFLADLRTQDAVVRRFEIIGEAARHLSPEAQKALPEVPWNLVVGMRNLLIHDYDDVDPKRVWTDSQNDLSPLIARLEKHLAAQSGNPGAEK